MVSLFRTKPEATMTQSHESAARDAKLAELKRLIKTGRYESQEKLEDAVDALLWSEHDRMQQQRLDDVHELVRSHPK
jgi:hypothetical protein